MRWPKVVAQRRGGWWRYCCYWASTLHATRIKSKRRWATSCSSDGNHDGGVQEDAQERCGSGERQWRRCLTQPRGFTWVRKTKWCEKEGKNLTGDEARRKGVSNGTVLMVRTKGFRHSGAPTEKVRGASVRTRWGELKDCDLQGQS